jgi:hypothetical protein
MRSAVAALAIALACANAATRQRGDETGHALARARVPLGPGSRAAPGGERRAVAPPHLDVHIVPHSHQDAGWIKTADQYAYGANNSLAPGNVAYIYDSVLLALAGDATKRFIVVEQFFWSRWFASRSAAAQATASRLIASGQLQFVNGGYVMHDEGATLFTDMITQTSMGHALIAERFGQAALPVTTWQIDPFGHSVVQASLLGPLAGMPSLFIGRVDYQDKAVRTNETALEMMWTPSPSLGAGVQSFTNILFNLYFAPQDLCWSEDPYRGCDDDAIVDDVASPAFNYDLIVESFTASMQAQAAAYRGNAILVTLGADFAYANADSYFSNMDRLMARVNANATSGLNVFYSTPARYAAAKLAEVAAGTVSLPTKAAGTDFFPYEFFSHGYLTGYFTSRPALKGFIRDCSALLHVMEQLVPSYGASTPDASGADLELGFTASSGEHEGGGWSPLPTDPVSDPLFSLLDALSIAQHHDAITGTSRQHVANDYARRLDIGRVDAIAQLSAALAQLLGPPVPLLVDCPRMNETACPVLQAGAVNVAVVAYNSRSQPVSFVQRIAVGLPAAPSNVTYRVIGADGKDAAAQLLPLSAADESLRASGTQAGVRVVWLAFALSIPAMGHATVVIQNVASAKNAPLTVVSTVTHVCLPPAAPLSRGLRAATASPGPTPAAVPDTVLSNRAGLSVTISGATGLLSSFSNGAFNLSMAQSLRYYLPAVGIDGLFAKSGAYIFRPNSTATYDIAEPSAGRCVEVVMGPLVQEARQGFAVWANQTVRLSLAAVPEIEWTVGTIPLGPTGNPPLYLGKEVITLFNTSVDSAGAFSTDANGRDLIDRVRGARPDIKDYDVDELASGNYYPVPTLLSLAGKGSSGGTRSFWVASDRAQGGSSLADGSLELMVHRRLRYDDDLGVGEALDDQTVVRGVHRFYVGNDADASALARREAQRSAFWRPFTLFADLGDAADPVAWLAVHTTSSSALAAPLPPNVEVLTARRRGGTELLLRLAHMFGIGEHSTLSGNATVGLSGLFADLTITAARETYITGFGTPQVVEEPRGAALDVTLGPLQIRTWICALQNNATE